MKIRSLLVAALPAALLLCTLPTSSAPAQSSTATPSRVAAEEYYVIIHYRDQAELQRIAGRFQHPRIDRQARTIRVPIDAYDMSDLRRMGVRMDIDPTGTSRLRSMSQALRTGRFGARALSDFACYRTVEDTHSAMATLAVSKPALAQVMNLGPTWKKWSAGGTNGYEMQVLRLTNSATDAIRTNKPAMVLLSSIHAREYAPAELSMRFGEWLVNGYGTDAEATWLLDNYVFYLIPQGNPDGRKVAENGTLWRKNINNTNGSCPASQTGVDLNRNFPFGWGGLDNAQTSSNACVETYRGPSAASEQETQNIMRLIAGTRGASGSYAGGIFADKRASDRTSAAPADTQGVYIDLHAFGGDVLWPWGDVQNSTAPNHAGLQSLGRRMGYYNKYSPYQSAYLYPTAGATDDAMYGELGVPSYTWELGSSLVADSTFFQPCSSFLSTILPDNLSALKYTARILTRPYRYPSGPETASLTVSAPSVSAARSITVAAGTTVTISAVLDDGLWGQTVGTADPTHRIASARAYIDTPPWEAGASGGIAMNAGDGSFSTSRETVTASISTTGLSPGRHLIYVQGVDASGEAGAPNAVLVNIATGGGGGGNVLSNGVAVTGLSGAKDAELRYTLQVPAGATNLRFLTSGGSGDADLYIKFGSAPTSATGGFDQKSDGGTNSETINVATAQAGTYHVLIKGYAAFSGASLTGSFTAGTGGSTQTYANTTGQDLPALATITSGIVVNGRTGNAPSNATLSVNISHTYRGDVVIDLIAPDGTVYPVKASSGSDSADNVIQSYQLNLSSEPLNGTWRLRVSDVDQQDSGRLNSWSLTF
ncbi:M14 family zinc carboxypeptidase [Lysobacter brunescens]|uniref:M14 family zinc carboxypeptidase n=1 Tax=Lysobacter brunescens TaxID=262323 RepID=A0ABW2Y8S3_9GAMM